MKVKKLRNLYGLSELLTGEENKALPEEFLEWRRQLLKQSNSRELERQLFRLSDIKECSKAYSIE